MDKTLNDTRPPIKYHPVMVKDPVSNIFRVGRLLWGYKPPGYKHCLSLAISNYWFYYKNECKFKGYRKWIICAFKLRFHYKEDERGTLI